MRIDGERLASYAASFPVGELGRGDADPGRRRQGDDEATASFVMALDAVNFGSGYFPYLRKRPGMSGYHTVATCLQEYVDATGPLTAGRLRRFTVEDCSQVFGQELDGGLQQELMQRFATAFVDLGAELERYDGTFCGFVAAAGHSAARLVEQLDRIPYFHDVATWRGIDVPLYKRAQITAFDLAQAFGGEGPGRFDDLHRLTMFPDNLVPHVLRVEGVLRFSDELVARIGRVDDITAGSEPEVEIRAVGLHAVELLGDALRARGVAVTSGELDSWLWNRGARPEYKAIPRHRTRSVFY